MLKTLGMQFNTLRPFATWAQPLEHVSGQQLTWAFMGHSLVFQVLMGVFELVPAAMLLLRRTALVGALLLLPMTIGVFLVNFTHGLWLNTRVDAAYMLAANVLILALERRRIGEMLALACGKWRVNRAEILVGLCVVAVAVLPRLLSDHYRNDRNELTGDWFHEGVLAWERVDAGEHGRATLFFGPNGEYSEINDSLSRSGAYRLYRLDTAMHRISISEDEYGPWRGSHYTLAGVMQYRLYGDTLTVITGTGHHSFVRRVIVPNRY